MAEEFERALTRRVAGLAKFSEWKRWVDRAGRGHTLQHRKFPAERDEDTARFGARDNPDFSEPCRVVPERGFHT
jgi:hypothetical protein